MTNTMFCPRCGAAGQAVESYCTRCGEWLPDLDTGAIQGLFRKRSREEKIRKIRVLEMVSAGLSLASAAIVIAFLATGRNGEMLFLAAFCALIVAVYQAVNIYLGHSIQHRIDRSRTEDIAPNPSPDETRKLNAPDASQFTHPAPSVVEDTTDLLSPIPRKPKDEKYS